jgi:hypothetical protein
MTTTNTLRHFIGQQNEYLHQIDCVAILGLSREAAHHHVLMDTDAGENQQVKLIRALKMATGIEAVYQTNLTEKEGKWLVVFLKQYDIQVKKFIDEELPVLYDCLPPNIIANNKFDNYDYPHRPGLVRQHGHTMSYAQALQLETIGSIHGPATAPPRGKRAPALIV